MPHSFLSPVLRRAFPILPIHQLMRNLRPWSDGKVRGRALPFAAGFGGGLRRGLGVAGTKGLILGGIGWRCSLV